MTDIYKVELFGGYVGLIDADSLEEANIKARIDQGRANVERVALANDEDIQWNRGMGGQVTRPKLCSEWAMDGCFAINQYAPNVGDDCDYYDRQGVKRQGLVVALEDGEITFDSVRRVAGPKPSLKVVTETFKIRYGAK